LQRPLLTQDNTTQKHKDNINASKGIRTHDPSNQAAMTYAVDRAATGIGYGGIYQKKLRRKLNTVCNLGLTSYSAGTSVSEHEMLTMSTVTHASLPPYILP
jgi:hypothetical protein